MYYLSEILGKPVKNEAENRIGRVLDLTIKQGEQFPPVLSIQITGRNGNRTLLWETVKHFDHDGVIILGKDEGQPVKEQNNETIFLKRDVLDKQIVDINGQRVVRVNDIQLHFTGGRLRAAGVDVGTPGLLRRMGLLKISQTITETLKLKTPSNIISWEMVQTLDAQQTSPIRLSTTRKRLTKMHPADLADILEELPRTERQQIFEILDNETAAETLEQMEEEFQVPLFENLSDKKAAHLLEEMSPDEAADLLQDLPDQRAQTLLNLMDAKEAMEVRELLVYPEDTAGGMMSNEFISVEPAITCAETIEHIRRQSDEVELLYYVYVVDEHDRLTGVVSLKDLIIALPDTPISEIMQTEVLSVTSGAEIKEVIKLISKYDLLAVPVVDEKSIIIGIITVDDVMDQLLPD